MGAQNELLDAIQILIDKSMADRSTRITGGAVKSASGGLATVTINGYDYSIPYSGTAPTVGSTVRVFIPNGNMSDAFIGGGGGGGGSTGTTNYDNLTNKPSINGTTLSGDKTSTELGVYGTGNEPPYPVTSVNGQTGDVTIEAGGVTSVNGKSGDVTLTASDVGAVAASDVTQTLGTSTTKVPSEKAVADALSGAGAGDMLKVTYDPTGSVEDAGGIPDYVAGQLPTVNDATLTIQKNGMAVGTFTANASANKSINITMAKGDVGLSNVDNVKQYSVDNPPPYPVTSVNGKTGAVTISVPTVPSTTSLIKGNGSGGLAAATRGSDYIASGNIVKQTLVATETTPTENYAINWVYG